jgi:hypothetical protein
MAHTAIDLFCGAGGLSAGLEMAGFQVLAGNDIFAAAGKTFSQTHPNARFIPGPVESVSIADLMAQTGVRRGELTVLVGGPPCQAYSVYNHRRGMHDARATLFKEYLRLVDGLRPQWIVMENVTGIFSIGGGEAVRAIKAELGTLGYAVKEQVLKSEDYGVPRSDAVSSSSAIEWASRSRIPYQRMVRALNPSPRSKTLSVTCPRLPTGRTAGASLILMTSPALISAKCAATQRR